MKKILVTGSTGMLGSSLAACLKKSSHNVVTHGLKEKADFNFDLTDRDYSHECLTKIQPDSIINLVGLTNVDFCEKEINLAYLVNTNAVETIASWILNKKPLCHLVHISTDQVYDGLGPHTEDHVVIKNNYAFSKYAGELVARNVRSTILRTNFLGISKVRHRESLTDWLYKSLIDSKNIQVFEDVYFSPLDISTLVSIIVLVIEKMPIGTYNLGSREGMSKADLAYQFANCLGVSTDTITPIQLSQATFLGSPRPRDMRMNSAKIEALLGITLPTFKNIVNRIACEYEKLP